MSRGRSPWFYLFIAWIAALMTGAFVTATVEVGEDFLVPAVIAIAVITVIVLRGPVGDALAMRLRGEVAPAELKDTLFAELDDVRMRMAELEERLDFSERLLAQHSDPGRLGVSSGEERQ